MCLIYLYERSFRRCYHVQVNEQLRDALDERNRLAHVRLTNEVMDKSKAHFVAMVSHEGAVRQTVCYTRA